MDPTGLIYASIVGIAYAYVSKTRPGKASAAIKAGGKQLGSILPTFVAIFGLVGLFEVFIPPATIQEWMGAASGAKSLLVAALVGSVAAGPPPAAYPIAETLLKSGAWMAAVATFIVSWVLVGAASLPFEAKLFGWKFALLRNALSFVLAMLIGLGVGVLV